MSHVVLVHGAWAGSWVWDTVTEPLTAAGHAPHELSLPGVGRWADRDVTLDDVAGHVAEYVAGLEGTVFVVGHSGGGIVATQVAEMMPDRVAGVAYVAGMMLPSGVDFGQLCDGLGLEPPVGISKWLQVTADGRGTVVPPEAAAAVFFHEADAVDAMEAARRLRPQLEAARLMAPIWTADRFGSLPRLYIEALRDRSVPLAAQREMQRLVPGATVVSLDTDHAPQLSARTELARALVEWCSAVLPAATVSVGSR